MVGKNKIANRNTNHPNGSSKNGNGNNSKRTEHNGGNRFKSIDTTDQGERTGHTNRVVVAKISESLMNIFPESIIARIINLGGLFRSKRAVSIEAERKQENGNGSNGGKSNGNNHQPFVSIHLPFYNEKNVADRILKACTSLDYENYEVIVADDSIDETVEILKKWKDHPKVKVIHRESRRGWKGGALNEALKQMDPRAEYVMVFDADFVPPTDIIQQFLPYFGNNTNGNHNGNNHLNSNNRTVSKDEYQRIIEKLEQWYQKRELAVVQGYQWHYLNAGENWLTKGIRAEYSSSYVIERTSQELIGSMKMIAGSVFMIKADIIKKYAWSTSMTEDWELTLRLYLDGYKVSYTPYIQAPAECPSTIPQLARQRMRWAEGHTFNVKKYFWEVSRSAKISTREKLEFVYYAPYYLHSFMFLIGTFFWFLSEAMHEYLPFWTQVFGWSLLLSNLLALPFMGLTGLFLERNVRRDFAGILSFIVMSYVLVPFQAYASLKGLLEKKERGTWIRTLKTGKITEALTKLRLGKIWREIFPRRRRARAGLIEMKTTHASGSQRNSQDVGEAKDLSSPRSRNASLTRRSMLLLSPLPSRNRRNGIALISLILLSTTLCAVSVLAFTIPTAEAVISGLTWYLNPNLVNSWATMVESGVTTGTTTIGASTSMTSYYWQTLSTYTLTSPEGVGTWVLTVVFTQNNLDVDPWTISVGYGTAANTWVPGNQIGSTTYNMKGTSSPQSISIPVGSDVPVGTWYINLKIDVPGQSKAAKKLTMTNGSTGSTLYVPENSLLLLLLVPLIPVFLRRARKGSTRMINHLLVCWT